MHYATMHLTLKNQLDTIAGGKHAIVTKHTMLSHYRMFTNVNSLKNRDYPNFKMIQI